MVAKKSEPGDGSPLPHAQGIARLWRSTFGSDHAGHRYDIAVDYFDWDEKVRFYVDGRHTVTKTSPAAFEVPDGRIDVAYSLIGLKHARLVTGGDRRNLSPGPGTLERWRHDLDATHPKASRVVSAVSWTVLSVALLIGLTELADLVLPLLDERLDMALPQESPIRFPSWMTAPAAVLGPIAAIDRALMMRHHWLLDD